MKPKIIRAKSSKVKRYGDTSVITIINAKNWPVSIAKIIKHGSDIHTGYDQKSDVTYYVLEGSGTCELNGKRYKLLKGDCVLIPKGTRYRNLKGLTLMAIALPRFDRKKRVYIE